LLQTLFASKHATQQIRIGPGAVHGGGWQAGNKVDGGPVRFLVDKGFAVAAT
jgi:hypothetical protein